MPHAQATDEHLYRVGELGFELSAPFFCHDRQADFR
jgi:hypothetical protein